MRSNYSLTQSAGGLGVEIRFPEPPGADALEVLKALRFRWHPGKSCWYGIATESAVRSALGDGTGETQAAADMPPFCRSAVSVTSPPPDAKTYGLYRDMVQDTNILIAGCVGSGKSELMHSLVVTIVSASLPSSALLWLADPKKVELYRWRVLPHSVRYSDTHSGIMDMMQELQEVMGDRYRIMQGQGLVKWQGTQIYFVIDELADLMDSRQGRDFSAVMTQIMQLSRAAGIHVIAGTQSPSRKVIPSCFQNNFTCCVGLKCRSAIESRQIIGIPGAERIPGPGEGFVFMHGEIKKHLLPLTAESEKQRILAWYTSR